MPLSFPMPLEFCRGCGKLSVECTCPLIEDTALRMVAKEAQEDRFLNPPDPLDFPER